jgi:hypothetical protein
MLKLPQMFLPNAKEKTKTALYISVYASQSSTTDCEQRDQNQIQISSSRTQAERFALNAR